MLVMSAQGNEDLLHMSLPTSVVTLACNPSPGEVGAEELGSFNIVHEFKASLDHIDTPWATL